VKEVKKPYWPLVVRRLVGTSGARAKQVPAAGFLHGPLLAALSLSDFWLFDHTRNYVFTYRLFALAW
jgi:hypothetical protein